MQKTAQKRSIFNKLREFVDIPSSQVEKFFKPELARVMSDLKLADDNIRTLLTSQKIGDADIDVPGGKPVKDLLKSARTNFNRREYMAGIAELGQFHKRLYDVSRIIDNLQLSVDKIHHNFLFQGLSDQDQESIKSLREHMSQASALQQSQYFIKEASVFDFFHNIGTKRGRSLAIWEKRYPKVAKELREQGSRLIDQAENVLANTLSNLKTMATARATRHVDSYMEAGKRISADYKKFDGGDKGFRVYYNNVVKPSLDQQDKIDGIKPSSDSDMPTVKVPDSKNLEQEVLAPSSNNEALHNSLIKLKELYKKYGISNPTYQMYLDKWQRKFGPITPYVSWLYNDQKMPSTIPAAPLDNGSPMSSSIPLTVIKAPTTDASPPPEMDLSAPSIPGPPKSPTGLSPMDPNEMRQFEARHGFSGSVEAHNRFLASLESLSEEDPRVLAGYISKYATAIKHTHPEKAIELFTIAKKLKG